MVEVKRTERGRRATPGTPRKAFIAWQKRRVVARTYASATTYDAFRAGYNAGRRFERKRQGG